MDPTTTQRVIYGPSAFTLLIGVLIATYVGLRWQIDPPVSDTVTEYALPRLLDYLYKGLLFASAGLLLIAAGLSAAGKPQVLITAFVGEALFAVTFGAMAIDTLIEDKTIGYYVFMTGILCFFGASSAVDLWRQLQQRRAALPAAEPLP